MLINLFSVVNNTVSGDDLLDFAYFLLGSSISALFGKRSRIACYFFNLLSSFPFFLSSFLPLLLSSAISVLKSFDLHYPLKTHTFTLISLLLFLGQASIPSAFHNVRLEREPLGQIIRLSSTFLGRHLAHLCAPGAHI